MYAMSQVESVGAPQRADNGIPDYRDDGGRMGSWGGAAPACPTWAVWPGCECRDIGTILPRSADWSSAARTAIDAGQDSCELTRVSRPGDSGPKTPRHGSTRFPGELYNV